MPLPLILGGIAAVAGAVGIYKGAKSVSNNSEAQDLNERAQVIYEDARGEMEDQKEHTTQVLAELGELKLRKWDEQIGRFVNVVEKVKAVEVHGNAAVDQNRQAILSKHELAEMRKVSLQATEVVSGGFKSLGAGALAGVASYGGAMMFASASTGTALSALSGVAATNATLAWFGGGSLAAGGLGMAGGAAVLGGIVAGPAIALGGFLMEAKSKKNLAEAKSNLSKAKKAAEEFRTATSMMEAICDISYQFNDAIEEMSERMDTVLDRLEQALAEAGENRQQKLSFKVKQFFLGLIGRKIPLVYDDLAPQHKEVLHASYQFAQALKLLLETPLLDKKGAILESSVEVIEPSYELLSGTPYLLEGERMG
ncbi:hypothetical protein P9578_18420 [Brevibacillus choshinensis]|uniref:hypothetical protein n=1 Tax=Brevibacillus choshinensis TaxID=54911 RepID=UPI002E22138B|nr:hypothetical protein [Brevibacillus choshinensis]